MPNLHFITARSSLITAQMGSITPLLFLGPAPPSTVHTPFRLHPTHTPHPPPSQANKDAVPASVAGDAGRGSGWAHTEETETESLSQSPCLWHEAGGKTESEFLFLPRINLIPPALCVSGVAPTVHQKKKSPWH